MKNDIHELQAISDKLVERLDEIFDKFNIIANKFHNRYSMACPAHSGDNANGCNIFTSGSKIIGNWKCWTHKCEETYGKGIIGFIRGILSCQSNKTVTYGDTIKWAKNFVGNIELPTQQEIGYKDFLNIIYCINKNPIQQPTKLSKEEFRKNIIIPADYYLKRGYKQDTMNTFDVGLCLVQGERFFSRVVIPIYDELGEGIIGSVARTTQPYCVICNKYHFANRACPQNNLEEIWSQKWLNSTGFKKAHSLYNFWNARKFIEKTNTAILVEGPGDVWRFHEAGIFNAVGMYGCSISDEQMVLLEKSGAMKLIIVTDNDEAGIIAKQKISAKCARLYNLVFKQLQQKDIGETSIEKVRELFNGTKDISY